MKQRPRLRLSTDISSCGIVTFHIVSPRSWNSTEHRFLAALLSIDNLLSAAYHLFPPVP